MAGIKVKIDWELRDYHINFLKNTASRTKPRRSGFSPTTPFRMAIST